MASTLHSFADSKLSAKYWRIPIQLTLAAVAALSLVFLGERIAGGSYTAPLLLALGIFGFGLLIREPILGLYLSLIFLAIVPYNALRLPLPLLHSPLSIVVVFTLAIGVMRQVVAKKPLVPSNLYRPVLVWCGILLAFAVVGHGPAATTRVTWSIEGLWPLLLVFLLVDTPRKARNVLLAFIVPLLLVAIVWIPALASKGGLSAVESPGFSAGAMRTLLSPSAPREGAATLLGYVGTPSWQIFSIMAMVWCVLFSIAVFGKTRLRWLAGLAAALLLVPIMLSTYGNAMLIVAEGMAFVLLFGVRRLNVKKIGLILILLGIMGGLLLSTASGHFTVQRISAGNDPSIESRTASWEEGMQAFLAKPIIGWGAYNEEHLTESGHLLSGHSGFLVSAYEFGLVYIAALVLLFSTIAMNLHRLGKRKLADTDQAIVIGIQALFASYIVQFFISGALGLISIDITFWFFIGLACLWLHWQQKDNGTRLVE